MTSRGTIFSKGVPKALPICLLALFFWSFSGIQSAKASTISINFNSLSNGATAAQIQTYIQSLLPAGATVTVGSGAEATSGNSYTADGNVVGPSSKGTVTPLTLGDTTGCAAATSSCTAGSTETYINNIGGTGAPDDEITMTFTGISLTDVSFDYEIFPNNSCTALTPASDCGGSGDPNLPTLAFNVDGTNVATYDAYAPGTNGTYKTSTDSTDELAPQALGVSGTLAISGDSLAWVDWPATIGIDNLVLTYNTPPSPVPEPSSLLLMGTGLLAVAEIYKRKRKATKA